MLNFDILKMYGKVAIRCDSKEQSIILCNELMDQYPKLMRYFTRGDSKYDLVNGTPVCYAPHIFDHDDNHVQLARERYWVNHGYIIIPFEALLGRLEDFGEIEKPDLSLDALFSV